MTNASSQDMTVMFSAAPHRTYDEQKPCTVQHLILREPWERRLNNIWHVVWFTLLCTFSHEFTGLLLQALHIDEAGIDMRDISKFLIVLRENCYYSCIHQV